MAERRMIHRKVSVSADLAALDAKHGPRAVLFYTWMIPHLDRWGCVPDDPARLLATIGPYWRDTSPADVKRWVAWMVRRGVLERVKGHGGACGLRVPRFHDHQSGAHFDREAASPFEPADVTKRWTRKQDRKAASTSEDTDRSGTSPSERKGSRSRPRPTPSPTPSPPAIESAAAPPEPEPGAQSPPPEANGHVDPGSVDLDAIAATSPAVRAGLARGRARGAA